MRDREDESHSFFKLHNTRTTGVDFHEYFINHSVDIIMKETTSSRHHKAYSIVAPLLILHCFIPFMALAFVPKQAYHTISSNTFSQITSTTVSASRFTRSAFVASIVTGGLCTTLGMASSSSAYSNFKYIPTQFIAALGDPKATSGNNAKDWGLWTVDPGPRGIYLRDYDTKLVSRGGKAPAGWKFDTNDWWLEEHGLIMEAPTFPMPAGRYLVTGDRKITTALTVDQNGNWSLDEGTLYDVTHLPCRSARYTPENVSNTVVGSPLTANQSDFPVKPGAPMPSVQGCKKQDYAVLFVIGKDMSY